MTLAHYIKFEGKRFAELTDEFEMGYVLKIAELLQPLEQEILQCETGTIYLKRSGNIFIDSFPPHLNARISDLIL